MNGLEKMRLQMSRSENSLRQDKINSSIYYINNTFQDDPSYQSNGVQIIDGDMIFPRIWNYQKSDNLSPTVEIQTKITEEFKRGQLLVLNGEYWLCLKSQCFHGMYWTGKLKQCTHLLYYQDVKTLNIESSWAVLERPYSKTLNNGQVITTSEMEFKAMMPFNDSTKKINLDRRLLTGTEFDKTGNEIGSVYKVTGRNGSSQVINGEGFLVLNMVQDVFNKDTDRLDLMIADYISSKTSSELPIPPTDNLLKSDILGPNNIRIGGAPRSYTAKFYDFDGVTELWEGISPVWKLIAPSAHERYYKISFSNNNSISVSTEANDELIGDSLKLVLSDRDGKYSKAELSITVVMM